MTYSSTLSSWPSNWPEDVRAYYEALARKWNWPESAVEELSRNLEWFRAQSESNRRRRYFRCVDDDGNEWAFETIVDRGDFVVLRDLIVELDGTRHRYSWDHVQDGYSHLTEGPLDVTNEHYREVTQHEFDRLWREPTLPSDRPNE